MRKQKESLVQPLQEQLVAKTALVPLQQQMAAVADNVILRAQIATLQGENEGFRTEIANLWTANANIESKLQDLLRNIGNVVNLRGEKACTLWKTI